MTDHEKEIENLKLQIDILRDQRDEARREAVLLQPVVCLGRQFPQNFARQRGWDCFENKENELL